MRVLLVEDEERIAAFLANDLSRHGFQVDWVTTGTAALARSKNGDRIDVVILDLGLPDLDGLDVLRSVRQMGVPPPWWC